MTVCTFARNRNGIWNAKFGSETTRYRLSHDSVLGPNIKTSKKLVTPMIISLIQSYLEIAFALLKMSHILTPNIFFSFSFHFLSPVNPTNCPLLLLLLILLCAVLVLWSAMIIFCTIFQRVWRSFFINRTTATFTEHISLQKRG